VIHGARNRATTDPRSWVVAICIIAPTLTVFPSSVAAESRQRVEVARASQRIQARVRRVEENLLPSIIIRGQKVMAMKLANRLKHYNTPGVSVAVVNQGRIEWARGFGTPRRRQQQARKY